MSISNSIYDESSELKEIYLKSGFVYSEEYDRYIKEGYGAFVSNIDRNNAKNFVSYITSSQIFSKFVDNGYVLVLGPSMPASNGVVYDTSVGVFVSNYKDVLVKKGTSEIKKEKTIDEIVTEAVNLATSYSTVKQHCILGFNLGNVLEVEANKLLDFEKEVIETSNNNKLFRIISALKKRTNLSFDVKTTLDHVVNTFTDTLMNKTYKECSKDGKVVKIKK